MEHFRPIYMLDADTCAAILQHSDEALMPAAGADAGVGFVSLGDYPVGAGVCGEHFAFFRAGWAGAGYVFEACGDAGLPERGGQGLWVHSRGTLLAGGDDWACMSYWWRRMRGRWG